VCCGHHVAHAPLIVAVLAAGVSWLCVDICLFEWPDRLAEMMPAERLDVFMEHGELNEDGEDSGERLMTLLPHGRDWERRVAGALERCIQQDLLVSVEDNTG